MLFKTLNYFDSQLQIMGTMSKDQFANLLAFVRAFLDELTVTLEKMLLKEFCEIIAWSIWIVIHSGSKGFAKDQSVCE